MAEEVEKIKLDNMEVKNLLDKGFVKKLEDLGEDISPISIILIKTKDKMAIPLVISHENKKEITDKIIHIFSQEQEFLDKVKDIVKQ